MNVISHLVFGIFALDALLDTRALIRHAWHGTATGWHIVWFSVSWTGVAALAGAGYV